MDNPSDIQQPSRKDTSTTIHPPTEESAQSTELSNSQTLLRSRKGTTTSQPESLVRRLTRATTGLATPERKIGSAPGVLASIKSILLSSWINVLLVFIPVSWALHFALAGKQDTVVFVCSFFAIIPLAKLLAFATDDLSMRVGQTLAGLLNATLGNAVELIVACKLRIVQASLVGSILSNLLLVLGMCFFAGGIKYQEQGFGHMTTQLNSSLLTISVIAVLLPAAFHFSISNGSNGDASESDVKEGKDILAVSHGVAIILLFIYGSYLVFQLYSHAALYTDKGEHVAKSTKYAPRPKKEKKNKKNNEVKEKEGLDVSHSGNGPVLSPARDVENGVAGNEEDEEVETPQLGLWMCIGLLIVVTVLIAVTAEFLVHSISGLTETGHISEEFVGIILLPIVGNSAEHLSAVSVSVKDKLTLSLGVAVGSSIQIALFVIPFIITLAWIMGKPLTLLFDPYESVALFLSVLTVNYVVQDGKSNWLEGLILMCLYLILGVTFWFYVPVQELKAFTC